MAKDFSTRPSAFFGLSDRGDEWLAYTIDRAVHAWGTFIQGKIDATKQVPIPKDRSKNPTMAVPKYSVADIEAMLDPDSSATRQSKPVDVSDPFSVEADDDNRRPRKEYRQPVLTG